MRSFVKTVRERLGMTQLDFAQKLGIKQSMASAYETGSSVMPPEVIERLFDIFNVDINFLFGRSKTVFNGERIENEKIVWIDLVSDNFRKGGFEVVNAAPVLREFIYPHRAPDCKALVIHGDNMAPEFTGGDCIFFAPGFSEGDGIYILSIYGKLVCRRLEFCLDGSVNVISDNTKYSRQTIPAGADHVQIVGRVICKTSRVR